MRAERTGLVILTLACVGLVGWNLRLQSQLAAIDSPATPAEQAQAVQVDNPRATAVRPTDRSTRLARSPGDRGRRGDRDRPRPGDNVVVVEGDNVPMGEARQRPERHERTAEEWAEMRAKMETATIDVVEAYAAQNAWEAATSEEVLAIFLDTGEAVGEVWAKMHDGETTHFKARREMSEIRDAAGEDVSALVGEAAYEELEEHLFEARRELFHH